MVGRCLEISMYCRINSSLFYSSSSSSLYPQALTRHRNTRRLRRKSTTQTTQNPSDFPHSTPHLSSSSLSVTAPGCLTPCFPPAALLPCYSLQIHPSPMSLILPSYPSLLSHLLNRFLSFPLLCSYLFQIFTPLAIPL